MAKPLGLVTTLREISGQVLFTPAEMFVLMEAPKGWPRA